MLDLEGDKEKRFRSGFNDFYETSSEKLGWDLDYLK
jgi:hypothetical protein